MSLYKEVLMKHFRNPEYKIEGLNSKYKIDGVNPSCGDNITIYYDIVDNRIENISYTGNGCAISMASADIMCEVINQGIDLDIIEKFQDMINGEDIKIPESDKLEVFKELQTYPARKNCALLPWKTLEEGLRK